MKRKALVLAIIVLMAGFSGRANAALIGLQTNGKSLERAALVGTLEGMGHTVTSTIDDSVDMIISAPGTGTVDFGDTPYLQISDHGADHLTNELMHLLRGTTVNIYLTGSHAILTGLEESWNSLGFWNYDYGADYVGWVSDVSGLAVAEVPANLLNGVLAISGNDIFIGWNVYGPDANSNDIHLLRNSIEFLTTGTVTPEPCSLLLLGLGGLVLRKRRI